LVAALAGFAGGRLADHGQATAAKSPGTTAPAARSATGSSSASAADLAALYKQVSPSVVEIVVSGSRGEGSGSGVIIDASGTILTNNHVISGAGEVQVILSDGRKVTGSVVGADPQWDLAVVRLANAPSGLTAATLGDSDKVAVGQAVFAIGAPFGLQGTLTSGVVSAVNRTFQGNDQYPAMHGLIQTDAAINPGNSGGPLFNAAGEVVGITTAIESPIRGSVGLGFAVPINQAQRALPALVRGSAIQHAFLGIQGQPASGGGVEILGFTLGSSAEAAGLRVGDVILSIGGSRVDSVDALASELDKHKVGEKVALAVRRGSKTMTVTITLRAYQGG
jgi:putative serine protease PepD